MVDFKEEEKIINKFLKVLNGKNYYETKLPINMEPEKKAYEKLGFKFFEIEGDSVMYRAILPTGWKMGKTDSNYCRNIFDNNGNLRASIISKNTLNERKAKMDLRPRFKIGISKSERNQMVYISDASSKYGKIIGLFKNNLGYKIERDEFRKLDKKARLYLEKEYSEWENPVKYWDEFEIEKPEPVFVKRLKKTLNRIKSSL